MSSQESDQTIIATLQQATAPPLQILTQIIQSAYPEETKGRMAVFAQDIVAGRLSLEEAAHLSSQDHAYLRTLVDMKLLDRGGDKSAVETALQEELLTLTERINSLFESPAAIRFQAIEHWAARELYMLITYSDTDIFTSSYLGVFDRLLATMRHEGLAGDQLLMQVHEDGQQSFHSFMAQYQRTRAWRIKDHGSFIRVVSQRPGRRIEIYANKFSEDDKGVSDIEALFRERHIWHTIRALPTMCHLIKMRA
jgi:hypothetical protein